MRLEVVVLALTASLFTALASVAQRRAAAPAPGKAGPSLHLIEYLLHRPVWFLGIGGMILGFIFQVAALRVGSLSLVQPIIATELVVVFAIIALRNRHRVHARDWLSALRKAHVGQSGKTEVGRAKRAGRAGAGGSWPAVHRCRFIAGSEAGQRHGPARAGRLCQ